MHILVTCYKDIGRRHKSIDRQQTMTCIYSTKCSLIYTHLERDFFLNVGLDKE